MTDSTNSADWGSEAVPNETSGRAGKDRRTDSNGATVGGKVRQMSTGKLLVVDDDNNLVELVRVKLQSAGYEVATASKAEDAIEAAKGAVFDLCILDLRLADRSGISLMRELHSINPDMPVIILTGYGSVESAVEAMQEGAYNYLTKPFNTQELLLQIKRALENRRLNSEIQRLRGLLEEQFDFTNIVARSDKMRSVLDIVSRIANTESTVYLHGESGTGKEIIAKAIHLASPRRDNPFVAINCAALPETLLESELFGHEKGAFTGAATNKKGLFEEAHGGTLLLDEIGEMPPSLQAKLLRTLQSGEIRPVGSTQSIIIDARVVAATNRDLAQMIRQGAFREDLFYRLNVIPVTLPPLRERREDIPLLAEHFLARFAERQGRVLRLSPAAM